VFAKTGREERAVKEPELLYLNPNYDYVKKRPPAAALLGRPKPTVLPTQKSPTKSPRKRSEVTVPPLHETESPQKDLGYVDRSLCEDARTSISTDISEFEDFFKAKSQWEKQVQNWSQVNPKLVRMSTADLANLSRRSTEPEVPEPPKELGPGAYEVCYKSIERTPKGGKFGTTARTKTPTSKLELALNPSVDFTKWSHPRYGIYSQQPKNDKLKLKEEIEVQLAEKAMEQQLSTAVDVTEAVKPKVLGGSIAPVTFELIPPHKLRTVGPGRYDVSYSAVEPA
jgi:hypothetical protein